MIRLIQINYEDTYRVSIEIIGSASVEAVERFKQQ